VRDLNGTTLMDKINKSTLL